MLKCLDIASEALHAFVLLSKDELLNHDQSDLSINFIFYVGIHEMRYEIISELQETKTCYNTYEKFVPTCPLVILTVIGINNSIHS